MTCNTNNPNNPKFPCKICAKNVHNKDKTVQYHPREIWIYIKCIIFNYLNYWFLQNCDDSCFRRKFCSALFHLTPYQVIKLHISNSLSNNSLLLKTTPNLELLGNHFDNATPENKMTLKMFLTLIILTLMKCNNIELPKNKSPSLFHINTCSPNENFDHFTIFWFARKIILT